MVDPDQDYLPAIAEKSGEGLRAAAVYVRREGAVEEASYEELQRIINTRIENGHSTTGSLDLKTHLDELKILYDAIPMYSSALSILGQSYAAVTMGLSTDRPKETYSKFILRMIDAKKQHIESIIIRYN